jgi:rhodanese-related sulfurtransferase
VQRSKLHGFWIEDVACRGDIRLLVHGDDVSMCMGHVTAREEEWVTCSTRRTFSSTFATRQPMPRDTPVIVYSADGLDSDRVVQSLRMRGSRAQSILGGLVEWRK